jgi:uncharacterized protein YndB with AHSA1/START domain
MKLLPLICSAFFLVCSHSAKAADSIVSEGLVSAPVAVVWSAWVTSSGLKSWLAPQAEIELRIDGLMRSNYDPKGTLGDQGTIENRVLAYEPERMLSIRVVKAPENFPFKAKVGDMWTVLYFQATPEGGTILRIVGLGFGSDDESQRMKEYFRQGNAYTLARLQKHFQK